MKRSEIKMSTEDIITVLKKSGCLSQEVVSFRNKFVKNEPIITTRSQDIGKGDVFIAYRGTKVDSHDFIKDVQLKKPAMIIYDKDDLSLRASVCDTMMIKVRNSREAWSFLSANSMNNPQDSMSFIGVTGTNGKTSTSWMLRSMLNLQNIPNICIGTLGIYINNEKIDTPHTTPDPPVLFSILREGLKRGVTIVVMEISSHSIVQKKISPIQFQSISWTSFSRDHLDFHGSMKNYWQAKWSVFSSNLSINGSAILNADLSPFPPIDDLPQKTLVYKVPGQSSRPAKPFATLQALESNVKGTKVKIEIDHKPFVGNIPFWGKHNLENFLNAFLLFKFGLGFDHQPHSWKALEQVPGRLQLVKLKNHTKTPSVFIDYAHTPDALENSLCALRPYCKGKLLVLFGCGGNRDNGKRPEMGKIAELYADYIVLSSDNPRFECSEKIIQDIKQGMSQDSKVFIEKDRKKALEKVIEHGQAEDFILVAGKGHENYQVIGETSLSFDDYKISHNLLKKREEISP